MTEIGQARPFDILDGYESNESDVREKIAYGWQQVARLGIFLAFVLGLVKILHG